MPSPYFGPYFDAWLIQNKKHYNIGAMNLEQFNAFCNANKRPYDTPEQSQRYSIWSEEVKAYNDGKGEVIEPIPESTPETIVIPPIAPPETVITDIDTILENVLHPEKKNEISQIKRNDVSTNGEIKIISDDSYKKYISYVLIILIVLHILRK